MSKARANNGCRVDMCRDCPFRFYLQLELYSVCKKTRSGRRLYWPYENIPKWCPLPEWKEEEK